MTNFYSLAFEIKAAMEDPASFEMALLRLIYRKHHKQAAEMLRGKIKERISSQRTADSISRKDDDFEETTSEKTTPMNRKKIFWSRFTKMLRRIN